MVVLDGEAVESLRAFSLGGNEFPAAGLVGD